MIGIQDAFGAPRGRGDAHPARVRERVEHGNRSLVGTRAGPLRREIGDARANPSTRRAEIQKQRRVAESSRRYELVRETELGESESKIVVGERSTGERGAEFERVDVAQRVYSGDGRGVRGGDGIVVRVGDVPRRRSRATRVVPHATDVVAEVAELPPRDGVA